VPFQRPRAVSREAHRIADETVDDPWPPDADAAQWLELARLCRGAVSPLARLESVLHPWTSYLVLPLFVLADAGVEIAPNALTTTRSERVVVGLVLARAVGKPLGIVLGSWLAVRLSGSRLPDGLGWRRVLGVGAAAGVPFSVSLFVAELSFTGPLLDAARVGVVLAAVVTGLLGFLLLRTRERASS
jgi:NhaA family Na+:H+ antiporter